MAGVQTRKGDIISSMLVFLLCLLVLSVGMTAAAKETLNQTNLTLLKGRSASLKVRGTKKKVRFTSSKRSVATVNAKGKVTAKKKGTAVITAKVGRKKLKCKVVVLQPVTKLTLSSRGIRDDGRRYPEAEGECRTGVGE